MGSGEFSPVSAETSLGLDEAPVGAEASVQLTAKSPKARWHKEPKMLAPHRLRIDGLMGRDEYFETTLRKRWLKRQLGRGVIRPFFLAHARQRGWPDRAAHTLGRVERVEVHGVQVPLDTPVSGTLHLTRIMHSTDTPVDVTIFLRDTNAPRTASWPFSWLFRSSHTHEVTPTVPITVTTGAPVHKHHEALLVAQAHQLSLCGSSRSSAGDDEVKDDDDDPANATMAFTPVHGTLVQEAVLIDVGALGGDMVMEELVSI